METYFYLTNAITIAALLLAIIFTAGIVWRTEKELDASYKFFLAGIVLLLIAEVADLYYAIDKQIVIALSIKVLRALFAVCFLIGTLLMRDIVRKLDGEKDEK